MGAERAGEHPTHLGAPTADAPTVLSTYVGHASVSDTYWYVTAIPELLALAAQRFAQSAERGDV